MRDMRLETPPVQSVKWRAVPLSDVVGNGKRLEATVFDMDSRSAQKIIEDCVFEKIPLIGERGLIREAHYGARMKRKYIGGDATGALGFLGSAEMLDVKPVPVKFLSSSDPDAQDLRVSPGMVLISRSGTIGNLTLVSRTLSPFLVSEHAMRLVCDAFPGYVYCFLKSDTGQTLIRSKTYGAVVLQIEPEHLRDIPVPNPPDALKEKIDTLILRSFALRDDSNDLIDAATALLMEALRLPPIHEFRASLPGAGKDVCAFSVPLSRLFGRLDGSYHIPLVQAIASHLDAHALKVTTLSDKRLCRVIVLPGRFKRVFVEGNQGVKFLGGKEIFQLNPNTDKYLSRSAHEAQLATSLVIREHSLLTTARGTLGKVALSMPQFTGWAISDNLMQILSYPEIVGYLYIFLNTPYGEALIGRFMYGGVVNALETAHVRQVPVPLLKDKAVQDEINALTMQANQKRCEAYLLEQQALKTLQEEVLLAR